MSEKETTEREGDDAGSAPPTRKRPITRRRLLIGGGAVLASGGLAAGGFLVQDHLKRFARTAEQAVRDHRVELPAFIRTDSVRRFPFHERDHRWEVARRQGGSSLKPDRHACRSACHRL